jgi:hypothetical protein
MPSHPFVFPYVGLGLLDEASIRHVRDAWTADYPDAAGQPYLRLTIRPGRTRIEEFESDGKPIAVTDETTLTRAIGRHGGDALDGHVSRFWFRAIHGATTIWTPLACDADYAFVPAIGLATVHLPMPIGEILPPIPTGPLATRVGLGYGAEPLPRSGLILRWASGKVVPKPEPVSLRSFTVPGILLEELAAGLQAVRPTPAIEWRPFADTTQSATIAARWPTHPAHSRLDMVRFAICEDPGAAGRSVG